MSSMPNESKTAFSWNVSSFARGFLLGAASPLIVLGGFGVLVVLLIPDVINIFDMPSVYIVPKNIKVGDATYGELVKIAGELQARDGVPKTLDDAIRALIRRWRER